MIKGLVRNVRNSNYLSMIGGTLLSSGIGAYINVVASTNLPTGVMLLLLGSAGLCLSGIALFVASTQLDSILKPIQGAPQGIKAEQLDTMWEASFRRKGTALIATFTTGMVAGIAGAVLLTIRLTMI